MEAYDPWEFSDGLPGDFDAKIVDTQFTYDSGYFSGQQCLCVLKLAAEDGTEELVKLSTGKNWEPAEKGRVARWIGPGNPKLNKQTALALFAEAVRKLLGEKLRDRGMAWEAKTWAGLEFHWDRVAYIDVKGVERSRLLPSRLVGAVSGPVAATNGHADVALPAKIKTALMRAAAESGSHEDFVERAMGLDGVTDEMRPAILSTQDGSIWATMSS